MKGVKRFFKAIGILLLIIVVLVVAYVAYVFIDYHRFGNMSADLKSDTEGKYAQTDKEYTVVSYNIGFGAYEADYDFFMDGGKQSWAWSKERLDKNLTNIADYLAGENADFYFIQEVDIDSTRSYHFDEREYLKKVFTGLDTAFVQNYDSPFLFYPLYQPHGISRSGLFTATNLTIKKSDRVELPVETSLYKLLDLDRCYNKSRIGMTENTQLVIYNIHLSAYTSDGSISLEQLKLLVADMNEEYRKGNYCIAGGDFNKDLLGKSSEYFGKGDTDATWAQPIPSEVFEGVDVKLVAPIDFNNPVASCRNPDSAYHEGQLVLTVDGFLVTSNVTVISSEVVDLGFAYSDHNPVKMTFVLNTPPVD